MNVQDLLRTKNPFVVTASTNTSLLLAIHRMNDHRVGAMPVIDAGGEIVGLVDDRSVVRAIAQQGLTVLNGPVSRVMIQSVPTCLPTATVKEVMTVMTRSRQRYVVVVDERELVGIVSLGDLVNLRLAELEMESNVLRDYIVRTRPMVT